MQIIQIDIDKTQRPKEVYDFFKEQNLQRDYKVKLLTGIGMTNLAMFAVLFIVFAIILYILMESGVEKKSKEKGKQKRNGFGDEVIKKLFGKYDSHDELEQELKKDYGIDIEIEKKPKYVIDAEREDWIKLSAQGILRAYGENEPDYSDVQVKEPNPKYNPCKKET